MDIKIAICDDENVICTQVESMLLELSKEMEFECEIGIYNDGEALCNELSRTVYELIFLDIELPKKNGVDVGKYIRELIKNETIQIAYISAKEGYAMELFDSRPINFLVKPLCKDKIKKVMNKYMVLAKIEKETFTYKKGYEYYKTYLSDIMYFECKNKKVTMVTKDGSNQFYDSMDNVYSKVKGKRFWFIHKSIIVNYSYIKKIAYEEITMINDVVLPISQSRRKAIREMHMEVLKEKD
ncbi:MAG: response regulator transcription factor [Lachnospiraceae bacterium]|nr:response regulator transcription factor [Lachnospiraceae bacterium]